MSGNPILFEIVEVGPAEWASFVETSPQASLFVSPEFLLDTGGSASFLLALRRGMPVAGSIRMNSQQPRQWFQFHSLVLSPDEHRRALRGSFSHACAARALFKRVVDDSAPHCRFSFHPTIVDVRALSWLSDELRCLPTWKIRFTGQIDLPISRVRGTLERLIQRGSALGFDTKVTTDTNVLVEVLARCGIPEVNHDLEWIEATARRLIARGRSRIIEARHVSFDSEVRSASLVVDWGNTAHVIFGGTIGEGIGRKYAGPIRDDFIVRHATQSGLGIVDLMGMEGKPRAEYKSGWTSRLVRWHEAELAPR